jgi:hypothetical protein
MLMSLADGKVAVCLEGGYNLQAISTSAVAVARTLMGEPPPKMEIPMLNKDAARVLAKVQSYQAPYRATSKAPYGGQYGYGQRRKKSFLSELFD